MLLSGYDKKLGPLLKQSCYAMLSSDYFGSLKIF